MLRVRHDPGRGDPGGLDCPGGDIDPDAVRAARRNVPTATLALGDARAVDLPDAAAGACVSNLPFGRRFTVHGEPRDWLRAVLVEMTRVTRPGGCVVVLSPSIPALAVPAALRPARTMRIRLLGTWTHLNAYDRT